MPPPVRLSRLARRTPQRDPGLRGSEAECGYTVYIGTWGGISTQTGCRWTGIRAESDAGAVKTGWPFQIPYTGDFLFSDVDSSPSLEQNGQIYASSTNGLVYAIGTHGQKAWEASLLAEIHSTPASHPMERSYPVRITEPLLR